MKEKIEQLIAALIEKTEKREMFWRSILGYETVVGDYHLPLTAVDDDGNIDDEGSNVALSVTLLFEPPIILICRNDNGIEVMTKSYRSDDVIPREIESLCDRLIEQIKKPEALGMLPSEGNNETICKILRRLVPEENNETIRK